MTKKSAHASTRDLAWALAQRAKRAGEQAPSVRGSDWRLATVTAVATDGTITAAGVTVRCLESYLQPTVGDVAVITQSSSGNWAAVGRLATNTDPIGAARTAVRNADLGRHDTITPTADPQIVLPVTADAVYDLTAVAFYSGVNDILLGWSVPSGTSGTWIGIGNGTAVVSGTGGGGTQQDVSSTWGYTVRTESTGITSNRTYGGLGATGFAVQITGTIRVGATAGTVAMAWAQGTSAATATNLLTDSWMRLHRAS
ncbi:hypothetical protein [Streptomyces sp. NPDC086519]|uniref:hypothetical protein n=1 Tax=Streptomyces sp. NPDC086519 TaxID=3154863 RepID=UPI00343E48F7